MELIMQTDLATAIPQAIDFNFDSLKAELEERLVRYNSLVVTEDSIKEAKEDRASLNKLKTALETKRKEVKKEVMAPYTAFEAKMKELVSLIDQPIMAIDSQVKVFEEQTKELKRKEIAEAYATIIPEELKDIIPLEAIMKPEWLNVSVKIKKINEELADIAKRTKTDMMVIDTVEPEYQAAVREEYIASRDIEKALAKKKAIQEAQEAFKKREEAKAMQEPVVEAKPQESENKPSGDVVEQVFSLRLAFQVTRAEAAKLKAFLIENNISHEKI